MELGTVTGAQTYNLYFASGTLDVAGLTGTSFNEINLSTNVSYRTSLLSS